MLKYYLEAEVGECVSDLSQAINTMKKKKYHKVETGKSLHAKYIPLACIYLTKRNYKRTNNDIENIHIKLKIE